MEDSEPPKKAKPLPKIKTPKDPPMRRAGKAKPKPSTVVDLTDGAPSNHTASPIELKDDTDDECSNPPKKKRTAKDAPKSSHKKAPTGKKGDTDSTMSNHVCDPVQPPAHVIPAPPKPEGVKLGKRASKEEILPQAVYPPQLGYAQDKEKTGRKESKLEKASVSRKGASRPHSKDVEVSPLRRVITLRDL